MSTRKAVSATCLIGAMLILAGCNDSGDGTAAEVTTTAAATTTTAAATTTTAAATTTTAAATTTTTKAATTTTAAVTTTTAAATTTTVATTTTTTAAFGANVITVDQSGVALYKQPNLTATPTGTWQTTEALKLINPATYKADVNLIAQLDSSGPDGWDPTKVTNGLVHITTSGPGYGGTLAKDWDPATRTFKTDVSKGKSAVWQGIGLIDGYTKKVVPTTCAICVNNQIAPPDVGPSPQTSTASENHGVGASMDGMWLYTEGTDSRSTYGNHDVLNVINARTLKVDKIINSRVHHARAYHDAALNKDLVIIDAWNNEFYIMDPADNHKIVKAMAPADLAGTGYTAFVNYAGTHLFIAARGGSFPGTDLGVFVVDLKTMKVVSRINIGDTGPTWVTFSANGKYAYVSGDHASMIAQIDISDANVGNWKMVGRSTAGVIGDYGVSLNWQDTIIFPTGKSEGASNKGEDTAIIVTSKFGNPAALSQGSELAPVYLNGCLRPDHSVVHPDPVVNELWFNCNSTMEMAVINMGNPLLSTDPFAWQSVKVVKANITATNPNGNVANANQGSSHGGAFAKYTVTNGVWKGELLSDTNGMHNSAIPLYKAAAAAAGN